MTEMFHNEKGQFVVNVNWHDVQIQTCDDFRRKLQYCWNGRTFWFHQLYLLLEPASWRSSFRGLLISSQSGACVFCDLILTKGVSARSSATLKDVAKMVKIQGSPIGHHHQKVPLARRASPRNLIRPFWARLSSYLWLQRSTAGFIRPAGQFDFSPTFPWQERYLLSSCCPIRLALTFRLSDNWCC